MKKLFTLLAGWLLAGATGQAQNLTQADFAGLVVPQYVSNGNNSGSAALPGPRLAVPFRATVSNLTPSTAYRYFVQAAGAADLGTTSSGAGNLVIINPGTTPGTATVTVPGGLPNLATAGQYGTFTTNATGSYTGWFAYLNTANAGRFGTPGTLLRPSITLATDAAPATIVARRALDQTVTVLAFAPAAGATNGTLLRGSSQGTAKNLAFTYDNTAGTGRPLSGAFIEDIGAVTGTTQTGANAYTYSRAAGDYTTVVPNALPTGIRRVEERSVLTGAVANCAQSPTGTWPSGANTVNPAGGAATALVLTATDTPLNAGCNAANPNAPTIASFTPTTGAAGATVTVTGTNFIGATGATLNGVAVTGFMVMSATSVMFNVPAGATSGAIAVTTPNGTATSSTNFTVTGGAAVPTITSFTPTSGPVGTVVTVTGTNFGGATGATINGTAGTAFMAMSATSVMFTVPTGATSGVITVTTPGGTATSSTPFTVTVPAGPVPTLTSVSPARAVAGGPAFTLTVNGTNLLPTTTIEFRGVQYPVATATAGTSATVRIPAAAIATVIASFPVRAFNGTTQGTGPTTFSVVAPATTVAYEDFERGTKSGYAADTVTLRSGVWRFADALVGTLFNDRVNQAKAARLRGPGSIAMTFDKPDGAGTVTIQAANYGNDTGGGFKLELSTDGGLTFTQVGASVTTLTNALATYTFTPNQAGPVRLKFVALGTGTAPRINLDDLTISAVLAVRNPAGPALAAYPNPTADLLTLALPGTVLAARTATVRDLLGRRLAELPVSAQAQVSLRGLAPGSYLLEVGPRTVRVTKE